MWKATVTLTDSISNVICVFTSIPIASKGMAIHYAMLEMKDSDQYRELISEDTLSDFYIHVSVSKIN